MVDSTQTQRFGLVLLPGMDGTGELFTEFVAALGDEFEITTAPYPTGQSLTYLELEGLVRRICAATGPFALLAESYSTPLAIRFAASLPVGLKGLILCAGFASSPVRGRTVWLALGVPMSWRRSILGWLW